MSSGVLERHTIPAPLMAPVVKNPVICHEIEKRFVTTANKIYSLGWDSIKLDNLNTFLQASVQ
jgi:hypothetical protein